MPMLSEIYNDRPKTIQSGAPLEFKVKVQHRSDILMQEQIENVKNIQDALKTAYDELELARSGEETNFLRGQVEELRSKAEEMMLILKVVHKLNSELVFARLELQKALKSGEGSVTVARRRVGWLEERMERVLGKQRQKSPDRGQLHSSVVEDPRYLLGDMMDKTLTPMTSHEGGITETDVSRDLSEVKQALMRHDMISPASSVSLDESPDEVIDDDKDTVTSPSGLQAEDTLLSLPTMRPNAQKRRSKGDMKHERHDSATTSTTDENSVKSILRKSHSSPSVDRPKSQFSETNYSETETSTSLARSEAIVISEDGGLKRGKGSRVTLKSPSEDLEEACKMPPITDTDVDIPMQYWMSEHHRFEMGEFADRLCQQNPLSYHQMGLAVPGTFVDEVGPEVPVPWVPKRKGSGNSDIHKIALDKLNARLHKIYGRVREAAMLSVRGHTEGTGNNLTTDDPEEESKVRLSLKDPAADAANKPSMSRVLSQLQGSQESIMFPPLDKDRLGSSMSGRLVYYPKPLPYPEKLPITRTALDKELPRELEQFSKSVPGKDSPAERFVNQHNLLKETSFTSSLYRAKTLGAGAGRGKKNYYLPTQAEESTKKSKPSLRAAFDMVKGAVKFNVAMKRFRWSDVAAGRTKWKLMKPRSGALDHSGLKWERVKSIVHNNLVSPCVSERIDGARHLGALNCCDAMVMYALKERLKHDEEIRVKYEATKSLVSLGCWEEDVLSSIVTFLIDGNRDIRADLLHAMSRGKNVQYVDKGGMRNKSAKPKKHYSFPELAKILSLFCLSDDPEDNISLDAAVCLGKLCVADPNAKAKLCQIVQESKDTHVKAEAMEILVRQLNYREQDIVDAILNHITKSPSWKNRKSAAKLLVYLGKRIVCNDNDAAETVYNILENRLWDDPNKDVRHECARAMASFDMFARACERAEKRLEDSSEEIRAQAVVTLGTLNVKNERIIRSLVEMLELDSSEFVRLVIIRTFAILNSQDKRIIRALKDKEKGDGPLARAARKTLNAIGVPTELKKVKGVKTGKTASSGTTNASMNLPLAIPVK